MPDPDHDGHLRERYAEPHPLVAEERAQFAAYQASFAATAEEADS